MIRDLLKYHRMPLLLLLSCSALYLSLAFDLERDDFPKLLSLVLAISFLSWKLFQMEKNNLKFLIAASLLFRLLFLFSTPLLSQDFHRFLWDGHLMLRGINPYLFTPEELMAAGEVTFPKASELLSGMGSLSAGNHSNYPPLIQLLFAFAALFAGTSLFGGVLAFRLLLLLAEVGIFYFGRKLLKLAGLPENRIFWFLLNPLIIIELGGSLHFEGVLIFFLLWSLYLLFRHRYAWAGFVFSLSVLVKLIPLIFLPLLLFHFRSKRKGLKLKKLLIFYSLVGIGCVLGFLPFLTSTSFNNYLATVALWFQNFEFNASIYYLLRWFGFLLKGYNIISTAGVILSLLILVGLIYIAILQWRRADFSQSEEQMKDGAAEIRENLQNTDTTAEEVKFAAFGMFLGICLYYFLSTTIHPWYLSLPLILGIFTKFRVAMVWSIAAFLSYSAYVSVPAEENLWLVALEYLLVFGYMGHEIFKQTQNKTLKAQ